MLDVLLNIDATRRHIDARYIGRERDTSCCRRRVFAAISPLRFCHAALIIQTE